MRHDHHNTSDALDGTRHAEVPHAVSVEVRLDGLVRDLDEPGPMSFYRRGRRYARVMTASHAAAAAGDAFSGATYLRTADELLGPLGEAGAGDLRDFIAGAFREDESRADFLLDNPDVSEPSMAAYGVEGTSAIRAFELIGQIVALVAHPARRTEPASVSRLILEQVTEVANLMSTLPSTYELAMLQGLSTPWQDLDVRPE
ncbi:MAG: hypothetical protein NVS3B1_11480 [Marmoricola sp.]